MLSFLRKMRERKEMEILRDKLLKNIEEVTHNSVYRLEITPNGITTAKFIFENGYTVIATLENGLNYYIIDPKTKEIKIKSMKLSIIDEQERTIVVITSLIATFRKIVFMPGRHETFYESADKVYGILAAVQLLPRNIGNLYEIKL